MQVIALTGGIASGKSTVSARLAQHGAVVIDADRIAREVVEPGEAALAEIVDRFGEAILSPDGSLNRPALGAIVFADDKARQALNDITHPAVWQRTLHLINEAKRADEKAIVVYDVPLLVEASKDRPLNFDLAVVVDAPASERIRRLTALRGMSPAEAESRVRAQASDEERLAVADLVIDSSGTVEQTLAQADALWQTLNERSGESA